MNKRKPLDVVLLIFKIVIPCFLALLLIFFSVDLYDQRLSDLANEGADGVNIEGFGIAFAVLLVVMLVACIFVLTLSLTGLIVSLLYKGAKNRRGNVIAYSVITASPILAFLLYLLIGTLIGNIGA